MKNIDHHDKASLNLEYARVVAIAISATHQGSGPLIGHGEVESLSNLVIDLVAEARDQLLQIKV